MPAMELAAAEALYDDAHEELAYHDGTFTRWAKERSKKFPFHYRDGVTLIVTRDDLSPDVDLFKKPKRWTPQDG